MKKIKVLIVYANSYMDTLLPLSITTLASYLHHNGIEVRLFDTTFYKTLSVVPVEKKVKSGQIKNYRDDGFIFPTYHKPEEDFRRLVVEYRPDLIALSSVETTHALGLRLIDAVADFDIPVIAGGVHTIFSPDDVLMHPNIDMVCTGEGENVLLELCNHMQDGKSYSHIFGINHKLNGNIVRNPKAPLVQLESKEFIKPHFEMFEEARFYRPMSGKIYRMMPIEVSRGCIYQCTYCSAPALKEHFEDVGKWMRYKKVDLLKQEIQYCIDKYNAEYFYMVSETFLAMPHRMFEEFIEMYSEFKIPFWFNTRPETITKKKIQKLEEVGCHRISVGLEHGNYEFRKNMLKRDVSDEVIIQVCRILQDSTIEFSVNNILGFPTETRELIFDTINLNRKFIANSHSISIFQPFRGTWLYDYCVQNHLYDKNTLASDNSVDYVIKNPNLSKEDAIGLHRTFNLYLKLPETRWSEVKMAEKLDSQGNKIFEKLCEEVF